MTFNQLVGAYVGGMLFFGGWFLTDYLRDAELREVFRGSKGEHMAYAIVFSFMLLFWWYFMPLEIADRINKRRRGKK